MSTINITQIWENLVSEIETKFNQIVDSLRDKEKQILIKLKKKKEKDLKAYHELIEESKDIDKKNMKKSMHAEKVDLFVNKLK